MRAAARSLGEFWIVIRGLWLSPLFFGLLLVVGAGLMGLAKCYPGLRFHKRLLNALCMSSLEWNHCAHPPRSWRHDIAGGSEFGRRGGGSNRHIDRGRLRSQPRHGLQGTPVWPQGLDLPQAQRALGDHGPLARPNVHFFSPYQRAAALGDDLKREGDA